MELILKNIINTHEALGVCLQFIQGEKIKLTVDGKRHSKYSERDEKKLYLSGSCLGTRMKYRAYYKDDTQRFVSYIQSRDNSKSEMQIAFDRAIYNVLSKATGKKPNWGTLIGIRPAKNALYLMNSGHSGKEIEKYFKRHMVNPSKMKLALEIAEFEKGIMNQVKSREASLYISIPFCPSRCSYCSFISHSAVNNEELLDNYVQKLAEEIRATGKLFHDLKLCLKTVYIGGGTPTTVCSQSLDKIIKTAKQSFDFANAAEFTVEAGRPDTITAEKLAVLKENGVTRISINPQTLNDSVLEKMGRAHSVKDFYDAFQMARNAGFDNINTDIIAGLEGDDFSSFCRTVDGLIKLSPENITMHTLCYKKAADIFEKVKENKNDETNKMVEYFYKKTAENNFYPYYIYKQKNTLSNNENVGFAKKGRHCLYNIFMMDEFHSVFSVGAGAVTKLVTKDMKSVERIFNYKYPMEYCDNFEKVINDKFLIRRFYDERYD